MDTTLSDPLIGQVLDDRYRIDALIAVGGMATVYRAVDTRLDRVLALKVMHPTLAADASFVERFIREAKSVARLAHPNVVGVFDQGADGAYVYLAMEYVAGCTLRDVLRDRGALRPRAALDILEPVLAALGAAHRAGFVHRDMKPENVLIGDDGRVKVADFGLVRAVDTVTSTTGSVLGTVSYLAPEQIEHGTAEPRADVYACGVLLYEMLTGGKPHSGDSPAQVLYKHLNEDVPPPSAAVPGLPAELDALVAAATARVPEARLPDAVALLSDAIQARSALTAEQLDTLPPGALASDHGTHGTPDGPANSADRTSVLPRVIHTTGQGQPDAPMSAQDPRTRTGGSFHATHAGAGAGRTGTVGAATAEDALHRTSRLPSPPQASGRRTRRTRHPRRGQLTLIAVVLAVLGLGAGVWYIGVGQFTTVPPLLAKTQADARQRLADAGLDVGHIKTRYSDAEERGTVISSDPAAGHKIRRHDKVDLTISLGPRTVKVPDLRGTSLTKAKAELKDIGLAPGMVTREFSDTVAKNQVIRTDPVAKTVRKAGSAVALTVSKGKPVHVPDVTGDSVRKATAELHHKGLRVRVLPRRISSPFDAGTIAKQSPGEDATAAEGDTITLTLSKGPELAVVPDVVGDDVDEAEEKLKDAGFEVEVDRGLFGGVFSGDEVEEQSVDGGDKAAKGSTITLKVG